MAYIKKLVMHGFKSFGKKTEIIFDKGINIFLGPNGSGKSNVTDALCFALSRQSSKGKAEGICYIRFTRSVWTQKDIDSLVKYYFCLFPKRFESMHHQLFYISHARM